MGTIMVLHGIMKIAGGVGFITSLGGMPPFIPENATLRLTLGTVALLFEIVGGLGVVFGYRFKTSCTLIILVMIPAFVYHLGSISGFRSFMTNTWPLELAFVFTAFIFIGPGKHTIHKTEKL